MKIYTERERQRDRERERARAEERERETERVIEKEEGREIKIKRDAQQYSKFYLIMRSRVKKIKKYRRNKKSQ